MYTWLPVAVPFLASLCFRLCEDPKQCSSILICVLLRFVVHFILICIKKKVPRTYKVHNTALQTVFGTHTHTRILTRKMEHPHSTNCRQSKQIIMFYQKKSKSTITNDKRTGISNPNKIQIRILLHCLGSSHKRKHQLARKGTATGSQVYMQQTS
jgi:hypothetical protein